MSQVIPCSSLSKTLRNKSIIPGDDLSVTPITLPLYRLSVLLVTVYRQPYTATPVPSDGSTCLQAPTTPLPSLQGRSALHHYLPVRPNATLPPQRHTLRHYLHCRGPSYVNTPVAGTSIKLIPLLQRSPLN